MPKRLLDLIIAAFALVLLLPVLALIALAVRLRLGRPVLFRQTRIGYNEKPFTLYKFRTMRELQDRQGVPLPDGDRLHPLGSFLRRASLDELPQLWNVLCGEMSLVGPRPLLPAYLSRYTAPQRRRHDVPPGITGWAQVKGRNAISWEKRFELDTWYVSNRSFALDCRILAMTLWAAASSRGVSADGHATMPEFQSNQNSEESSCRS